MNGLDLGIVRETSESGDWLIGRDPIGVIPLYYGRDADGNLMDAYGSRTEGLPFVTSSDYASINLGLPSSLA